MECKNCHHKDFTYNVFNYFLFPLEKIYNSLNQQNVNYRGNFGFLNPTTVYNIRNTRRLHLNDTPKLNLDNCFTDYESEELLTGTNKIYCNHCYKDSEAITFNKIYKAPEILIIILNRGKGNKFKCDVDFPQTLDISKYVKRAESPKKYNLIGVISHLGQSSMEGHFIAFCKHFDDNWRLFNDAIVTNISNESEIFRGTPYILFYQWEKL